MFGHLRSLLPAKGIFCNENEAPRPALPPPRFARCASSSGPPPPLSRGRKALAFSQRDPRRSFINGEARIGKVLFAIHHSPLAFVFPHLKRGGRTPTDAESTAALTGAARAQRSAHACRRSTAALA